VDHQLSPGTAGAVITDQQPPDKAGSARNDERALEPAAITWTRAQLRDQIQRAGAAPDPTAQPTDRQTREMDRSPLADREPEP
jgi:hypothetical protein